MCLIKITLHSPVATKLDNNAVKKAHIKKMVINGRSRICSAPLPAEGMRSCFVGWQDIVFWLFISLCQMENISGRANMNSVKIHKILIFLYYGFNNLKHHINIIWRWDISTTFQVQNLSSPENIIILSTNGHEFKSQIIFLRFM